MCAMTIYSNHNALHLYDIHTAIALLVLLVTLIGVAAGLGMKLNNRNSAAPNTNR